MNSKILVVGCGGLGCELLKILATNPNNKITVVDDDTIDLTNLNRQFFFVKSDVNLSKCQVACKKILNKEIHPECEFIFDRIDNYKKIEFYQQFDVVYNCLDNDMARSFVNQRCLLASVRLIDGGSAGWLGQSFCNAEECFDCIPKQTETIHPVCSIRQKPKIFEHCLIWAKAVQEKIDTLDEELDNLMEMNLKENDESQESDDSDLVLFEYDRNNKKFKENSFNFNKDKIISEIKNLTDSSEIIYKLASLKADIFSIQKYTFLDSQTFLKRIIPSICTTNSIIASLMVLSEEKSKNFYLVQGSLGILMVDLNKKRNDCFICSLPTYRVIITFKTTISSFLKNFNGKTLNFNTEIFDEESNELLSKYDGEIMICIRNDLPHRVYFQLGKTELIKRIR